MLGALIGSHAWGFSLEVMLWFLMGFYKRSWAQIGGHGWQFHERSWALIGSHALGSNRRSCSGVLIGSHTRVPNGL